MELGGLPDSLRVLFRRAPRGVELPEQARVLQRDRRVVGESSQQSTLFGAGGTLETIRVVQDSDNIATDLQRNAEDGDELILGQRSVQHRIMGDHVAVLIAADPQRSTR